MWISLRTRKKIHVDFMKDKKENTCGFHEGQERKYMWIL